MTTKQEALDTDRDWPPAEPDTELGSALQSVLFDGSANFGTFLRRLMVPQKLTALAVVAGGTYDTVTLAAPGAVLAVNGNTTGVMAEKVSGTPTTGTYVVTYSSDGVAEIKVLAADGNSTLDVTALQLPQAMADVLGETA